MMSGRFESNRDSVQDIALYAIMQPDLLRMYLRGATGTGKTFLLTRALVDLARVGNKVLCFLPNEEVYRKFLDELAKRRNYWTYPAVLEGHNAIMTLDNLEDTPYFKSVHVLIGHQNHAGFIQLVAKRFSEFSVVLFDELTELTVENFQPFLRPPCWDRRESGYNSSNRRLVAAYDSSRGRVTPLDNATDLIRLKESEKYGQVADWNSRFADIVCASPERLRHTIPAHCEVWLNHTDRPMRMIDWCSKAYYQHKLVGPNVECSIEFIDTSKLKLEKYESIHSGSMHGGVFLYNRKEANLAVQRASDLVNSGVDPSNIGIMAGNQFQVQLIAEKLYLTVAYRVKVGQQADFLNTKRETIIFTMTISNRRFKIESGMLHDGLCCMAMTRATKRLIWIGNGEMLENANCAQFLTARNLLRFLRDEPMVDEEFPSRRAKSRVPQSISSN